MGRTPIIQTQILSLLAVCGCVSRQIFLMMPFTYNKISTTLKSLVDLGAIRLSGRGANKHYALLDAGKNMLEMSNPSQYPRCLFANNNTLLRVPTRALANGDTAALLSLAGYFIHPKDKPLLPVHANLSDDDNGWFEFYQKAGTSSAANCYYTSTGIKRHFRANSDSGFRYSRACGILFTPDCILRVYHSRSAALELRETGERKLYNLIPRMFSGYLPKRREGLLVFGTGFAAAENILAGDFDAERIRMTAISKRTIMNTQNLGKPMYYRPVRSESLALTRLMRYPGWEDSMFEHLAKQVYCSYSLRNDAFYAAGDDGSLLFIGVELNLTKLARLIRYMREVSKRTIRLLCLDWQKDFYKKMLELYTDYDTRDIHILTMENGAVLRMNNQFAEFWGNNV